MHDVIDKFFDEIKLQGLNLKNIEDEEIEKIIEEIINEKLNLNKNYIFSSTPKYKVLARRLKRVVLKSMKYIIDSLK